MLPVGRLPLKHDKLTLLNSRWPAFQTGQRELRANQATPHRRHNSQHQSVTAFNKTTLKFKYYFVINIAIIYYLVIIGIMTKVVLYSDLASCYYDM